MTPYPALTVDLACATLAELGLRVSPDDVRLEPREERWLVHLPDGRLAWFAASVQGRRRLATERRVLRLLAARCGFAAPRVVLEAADGACDVRTIVPGTVDPREVIRRVRADPRLAARLGAGVGAILAEQHTRVTEADVAGWLARRPRWPEPSAELLDRLPAVTGDDDLVARARAVLAAYDAQPIAEPDRALVHADVGFHNLALEPASLTVRGLFDYGDAAWADRHHDFRYLVFDLAREDVLDAARAVYEPAVGRTISCARVALYNAACAIGFLANRAGTRPEQRPCGRTLEEDLRWTRCAIARALTVIHGG